MSKLSKIKQTKEAKNSYNHPIVGILAERCTKQDLMEVLHCSERDVRDIVAECSMHYPVITYSVKGAGYRRAKPIDELSAQELALEDEEVMRSINELNSRIKCLKKRLKPLIAWHKMKEKLSNIQEA